MKQDCNAQRSKDNHIQCAISVRQDPNKQTKQMERRIIEHMSLMYTSTGCFKVNRIQMDHCGSEKNDLIHTHL